MMGLSDWVYWTNIFLNGFLTMALVSIVAVIAFKVSAMENIFPQENCPVVTHY